MIRKLKTIFRKRRLDAEMAEEMRLQVELQTELHGKPGMDFESARLQAHWQSKYVARKVPLFQLAPAGFRRRHGITHVSRSTEGACRGVGAFRIAARREIPHSLHFT